MQNIDKSILETLQQFAVHFYDSDNVPLIFSIPLGPHYFFTFNMQTGQWAFPLYGLSGKGCAALCAFVMGVSHAEAAQRLSTLLEGQA